MNKSLGGIISSNTKGCIEAFLECQSLSVETVIYIMNHPELGINCDQIKLIIDCAEISQVTANFITRDSFFSRALLEVGLDIYRQCLLINELYERDNDQIDLFVNSCQNAVHNCQLALNLESSPRLKFYQS